MLKRIFIALLLDILAFTMVLPLLPRLMDHYRERYVRGEDPLFGYCMQWVEAAKRMLGPPLAGSALATSQRLDIVLFGGAMGSLFAMLQFLVSPVIGRLSDRVGRKRMLLWTMLGNIMSALLWTFASTFALFTTSRIIGGLSEGNVQLSIAMISDVTTARDRSRGLALVGIAFALGFTVGPALGAYVAAMDMRGLVGVQWMERVFGVEVNAFSAAAGLCLLLLTVETVFIAVAFEETSRVANGEARSAVSAKASVTSATTSSTTRRASPRLRGRVAGTTEDKDAAATTASTGTAVATTMATLSRAHFTYLFFFSGAEFALTFLTYDRFRFTNIQQGMLLGTVGILSALVQGAYVRRMAHRVGERRMLMQGMASCVVALSALAVVGTPYDYWWTAQATTSSAGEARRTFYSPLLLVIVIAFAFASATVVNGLNALASLRSGIEYDAGERGAVMGRFRSVGQLGRALGPVVGCAVYWLAGGVVCYAVCASGVAIALGGVLWAGATKERVKSEVKAGVVMKQVKPKASLKRE